MTKNIHIILVPKLGTRVQYVKGIVLVYIAKFSNGSRKGIPISNQVRG